MFVLGVELDDESAVVVDSYHPDTRAETLRIALIPAANSVGDGGEHDQLVHRMDLTTATTLSALADGGISLICTEGMAGSRGTSVLEQCLPETWQRLKPHLNNGLQLVGIDELSLESAQRDVQHFAATRRARNVKLINAVVAKVTQTVDSLPPSHVGTLARLRHRWQTREVPAKTVTTELLRLVAELNVRLPNSARSGLRMWTDRSTADAKALAAEQTELFERIKEHVRGGVFDPHAALGYRDEPPGPDWARRLATTFGPVPLMAHEIQALRHWRHRLGIAGGLSIAFQGGLGHMEVYQSSRLGPRRNKYQDHIEELYDAARTLGIWLDDYPNFARAAEAMLLRVRHQDSPLLATVFVFDEVFRLLEQACARTARDQEILNMVRHIDIVRRLGVLEMAPADHTSYVEERERCRLRTILQTVTKAGAKLDATILVEADRFDSERDRLAEFYSIARQRAAGFVTGVDAAMRRLQLTKGVLVCLGFHLPVVKEMLRAERIGFDEVYPNPSQLGGSR